MNVWINTDEQPPENWTEAERLLCLFLFWSIWYAKFRQYIIQQHEQKGDMFSHADGIIQSILKGMEHIDRDKLIKEFKYSGLISEKKP